MAHLQLRKGRRCVFLLHAHLVFVTKYRKKVFKTVHYVSLKEIFLKVCTDFGVYLVEMDGEGDHVHLLINYPPKVAISSLVNSLKGVSSRMLKTKHRELASFYYQGTLWSPSYFAGSCGGASLDVIKTYIKNQKMPK